MYNGIGIDFGATACRAALCENGTYLGTSHHIPAADGPLLFTLEVDRTLEIKPGTPDAGTVPWWLRLESIKAHLGTGRRLRDAKGYLTASPDVQTEARLKALRSRLEDHEKIQVHGAAIGVPACFGMNQRAALRSAGEAAGFGRVSLIDEAAAAALCVYRDCTAPRHVLAYCLGRSVFAVSVLSLENRAPRALGHEGSTRLGGQDFEAMLVQDIVRKLQREQKVNITYDTSAFRELIRRAEQTKILLSSTNEATIEIGPCKEVMGCQFHGRLNVSRSWLEALTAPLIAQTIFLSHKAIRGAGIPPAAVDEVLLVGEAAKAPAVADEISRHFGVPTRHAPTDAVARGAALYAASLYSCYEPLTATPPVAAPTIPEREADAGDSPAPVARADDRDVLLASLQTVRRLLQADSLEDGIQAFEALLRQAREEISYVYSRRASQLRHEGRANEAQAQLERGLEHWPDNTHIRRMLSDMHAEKAWEFAKRRMYVPCGQQLRKSLLLDPGNSRAQQLEAELEQVLGRKARRSKTRYRKP